MMRLSRTVIQFSPPIERWIIRIGWAMAWFGLVAGQLHALSRHATPDGRADLNLPLTRVWSVPASDALSPLLTWSDPYTVYATYGKLWVPVYASYFICALVVHSHRDPRGLEKWGWRLTLTAYALMIISIVGDYFTPWIDESFIFLGMPSAALTLIGAPMLGMGLLRNGFRPRITPWVLILWLPLMLAITSVTSLGSAGLPEAFAWAYAAGKIASESPAAGSMAAARPAQSAIHQ